MTIRALVPVLASTMMFSLSTSASGQPTVSNVPERRWSFDVRLAARRNRHEDVSGTGLHVRFAGDYKLDDLYEVRAKADVWSR